MAVQLDLVPAIARANVKELVVGTSKVLEFSVISNTTLLGTVRDHNDLLFESFVPFGFAGDV